VQELYAPFHEAAPYDHIGVFRDEPYGTDDGQLLDVFAPDGIAEPRPVVMFVPGSGNVDGERRTPATRYYDNVGVWAARNGFVGVTMSYGIAAAVAWVRANIAAHGGDPNAIVLLGQSAGATQVAAYGAGALRDDSVRALALMSGVYESVPDLVASGLPVLVGVCEFDAPAFHHEAQLLLDAIYQRDGRCANFLYLPRHNHLSQIAHLNALGIEDPLLAGRLAEFARIHTTPAVAAF
jgi:hypothetical protein